MTLEFFTLSAILFFCTCKSSAIRADWRDYLSPQSVSNYIGKSHGFFNNSLFQGDISNVDDGFSADDVSEMAANAVKDDKLRWENGIVFFEISSTFGEDHVRFIKKAMSEITRLTDGCIKFKPKTTGKDYIRILSGFGCMSAVGRQGGEQRVTLSRGCLESLGDSQHEFMHVLGFFHELSRADRDDYVSINWENIPESQKRQFDSYDGLTYGLPYDYASIMHYSFNAFAKNADLPSILPTKKGARIGQNDNLSELDIQRIKTAYKCGTTSAQLRSSSADLMDAKPVTKPARKSSVTQDSTSNFGPIFMAPVFTHDITAPSQAAAPGTDECRPLSTEHCAVAAPAAGCKAGYLVTCSEEGTAKDVKEVLQRIADLDRKPRPIFLTLQAPMRLPKKLFSAVENEIRGLFLAGVSGLSKIALPNLVHLSFTGVSKLNLRIVDLKGFPRLNVITFERTSFSTIEINAFAGLTELKLLALEKDAKFPLDDEFLVSASLLHCDCNYAWLRTFLDGQPGLMTPKTEGEVYAIGHLVSPQFLTRDLYLPVDCSKEALKGKKLQTLFSVNLPKCSAQ